ncbi:MAG: transcriptional regulator [Propionibacteriaceae bacterium]|jgi:DNA-binding transcriptional regulator LsrR (DeoR family)|nr:transcriptional regulator [Propionibacteriaceae bacterium]
MHDRYDDMYEASTRYYVQDETMESIARHLQLSRSSVSRLLADARASGMVRITVEAPEGSSSPVARSLSMIFGVHVHVVTVGETAPITSRFERVSKLAAALLRDCVHDGNLIGAAWGVTVSNVVPFLERRPLHDATIVQMNGGTNIRDSSARHVSGILQAFSAAFDARIVQFPVPAFFDYAETKQAMWRERSVQLVLNYQSRLDVAVFGIGSLHARVPSHVYTAGFLDQRDLKQLRTENIVGDVCTVLLRADGTYEDIELNQRASGLTPAELQRIPRRIGVVGDPSRATAVLAALRAKTMTDLVCDDTTARALLDLVDGSGPVRRQRG